MTLMMPFVMSFSIGSVTDFGSTLCSNAFPVIRTSHAVNSHGPLVIISSALALRINSVA
jgi:hypothetical protein